MANSVDLTMTSSNVFENIETDIAVTSVNLPSGKPVMLVCLIKERSKYRQVST